MGATMTLLSDILIIGIGSDYGDDRAGLVIAEKLSQRLPTCATLRLRSPLAVLDHLSNSKQLLIVDACRGGGPLGTITRYKWPIADEINIRFSGTHDFGLIATLHLADGMGLLPPKVTIWSIEIADQDFRDGFSQPLSPAVARGAELLVDQVVDEITAASSLEIEQLRHA
jgi:hydrogenase maturation protease